MEFKGQLGQYKIIPTEDNTLTVWSEYFDEACHNLSGAREETLHNYIAGCEISAQVNSDLPLHVLDVGFGIGLGLFVLAEFLDTHLPTAPVTYTSIELDEGLLCWSLKHTLGNAEAFSRTEDDRGVIYKGCYRGVSVTLFVGDGRKTLKDNSLALPPFTAIFQDPFSPKKNPALWSVEWFRFLRAVSSPAVKMATYSSSISIRKSMLKAGWSIENARGFGKKRSMTKANLLSETDKALTEQLKNSPILEIVDN